MQGEVRVDEVAGVFLGERSHIDACRYQPCRDGFGTTVGTLSGEAARAAVPRLRFAVRRGSWQVLGQEKGKVRSVEAREIVRSHLQPCVGSGTVVGGRWTVLGRQSKEETAKASDIDFTAGSWVRIHDSLVYVLARPGCLFACWGKAGPKLNAACPLETNKATGESSLKQEEKGVDSSHSRRGRWCGAGATHIWTRIHSLIAVRIPCHGRAVAAVAGSGERGEAHPGLSDW